MQLVKFALGIRIAAMAELPEKEFARRVYEEVFSVLTLSELEGLQLFGGSDPLHQEAGSQDGGDIFLAVIMGGKIKTMRRVFEAIDSDAAINMYLTHSSPYIENNRLARVEGLTCYGTVMKNGRVEGGDGTLDGLTVPKKRGKRSPVGKGIKLLAAPEDFSDRMTSADAVKLVTLAARKHFQGVKLVPAPVNYGGRGFARAIATACDGTLRTVDITSPDGTGKLRARYAVLHGKTAAIETAEALPDVEYAGTVSSRGVGELIRRALDEGLRSIIIGVHDAKLADCGFGLARALGVKFFDGEGAELSGSREELMRVASADAEFLLPALAEARIVISDAAGRSLCVSKEEENFAKVLSNALARPVDCDKGAAGVLAALTGGEYSASYDCVLDAMGFEKLLKGVALVVTGCSSLDDKTTVEGRAVPSIIRRCKALRIPVAVITQSGGAERENALDGPGVMYYASSENREDEMARFGRAADDMFRLIRIGRDVEKIGAPKKPRQKSFVRMQLESWKEKRGS